MVIEWLEVAQLRNLLEVRLELAPQFNYLIGPNGAGKTSVLEAVHLLARGRSFRAKAARSLVTQGAAELMVRAQLAAGRSLAIAQDRNGATTRRIDRQPGSKQSETAALLPLQLILPDVSDLVFGSPVARRRFLDWGMFHVEQTYLGVHRRFLAALKQRNALLRDWTGPGDLRQLGVWTETLCQHGEELSAQRQRYVADLSEILSVLLAELDVGVSLDLAYATGWGDGEMQKALSETEARDVKSGTTNRGPHRADLMVKAELGEARTILSRGQGKAVAIALHVAQARLLRQQVGRQGLFLMDELSAELDEAHLKRLLGVLEREQSQVLTTATRWPETDTEASTRTLFHVEQGRVTREPRDN